MTASYKIHNSRSPLVFSESMQMRRNLPMTFSVVLCALVFIEQLAALPDPAGAVIAAIEPPRRPEHFRNMQELNAYLAELRQYYTILGRPR